jgi:NAD-dependent deacetylase
MFGEPIPTDVMHVSQQQTLKADCMLLLGTSAVVYPAAAFPSLAKQNGAHILEINTEGSALSEICDVTINGPTGKILPILVQRIREIKEI